MLQYCLDCNIAQRHSYYIILINILVNFELKNVHSFFLFQSLDFEANIVPKFNCVIPVPR